MEKQEKIEQIQNLRKELSDLIVKKVRPTREKLDKLLQEQAHKICPFKINDIITLNNGKKGIITEINYHSLDYNFAEEEQNEFDTDFIHKVNEIEYRFAYSVDKEEFSITWSISGFRMKNNDTEVGKIRFQGISPIHFIVNKEEMTITDKPLSKYMNLNDMTIFNEIK